MLSVVPQVGSGEGKMYADLTSTFVGLERMFLIDRPSAQKGRCSTMVARKYLDTKKMKQHIVKHHEE